MNALIYAPRYVSLASLLALAACELPTKLGNLSDSATSEASATASTTNDSAASDGTTGTSDTTESPLSATTGEPSTSGVEPSSVATTMFEPSTGINEPADCDGLSEGACIASGGCIAYYGTAYDFPGCSEEPTYLGCSGAQDCDNAETTLCKDGTDEIYKLSDACYIFGFTECEPEGFVPFCGQCEALDETECLAEPTDCQPIYGAPHVDVGGETCADYDNKQFLRCIANGGACPPFIPVICPIGQPDEIFDSPSGCIPGGFTECGEAGTPSCL